MTFENQKLVQTYYQCLEYAITAHFNISFLFTLALKTKDICHNTIDSGLIRI